MSACPYCEKLVDANETLCPYCGNDISDVEKGNPYKFSSKNELIAWLLCTALAVLANFDMLAIARYSMPLVTVEVLSSALIFRAIVWLLLQTGSWNGLIGKGLLILALGGLWFALKFHVFALLVSSGWAGAFGAIGTSHPGVVSSLQISSGAGALALKVALVILAYFLFQIGPIMAGARFIEAERTGPIAAFMASLVPIVFVFLMKAFMLDRIFGEQPLFLPFIGGLMCAPFIAAILGTTVSRSLGLMIVVASMQVFMLFTLATIGISMLGF